MEMKLEIQTIENSWMGSMFQRGWGNGYVILPKEHPFHGVEYDILNEYVNVHGGLTYSNVDKNGNWKVGFDTAHLGDTLENWPEEAVIKHTEELRDQFIDLANHYTVEQVKEIVEDYYKEN
jgi:hypothetical protein